DVPVGDLGIESCRSAPSAGRLGRHARRASRRGPRRRRVRRSRLIGGADSAPVRVSHHRSGPPVAVRAGMHDAFDDASFGGSGVEMESRALRVGRRLSRTVSWPGVAVGTLLFALSLTPSLLPRSALTQGFVSGFSFAAGYALGVLGHALWRYLELPAFSQAVRRAVNVAVAAACVLAAAYFLWKASAWQDSIRALMGMEPSEGTRPLAVGF